MSSIQRNRIIPFSIVKNAFFSFYRSFHHLRKNVKTAEKEDVSGDGIILGEYRPKQENNFKY
jgi:hypothetical protein